jgi:hypothetical protein
MMTSLRIPAVAAVLAGVVVTAAVPAVAAPTGHVFGIAKPPATLDQVYWRGRGGWGWGGAVVGGLAAGALIGGALASPYGPYGYGYAYGPGYYAPPPGYYGAPAYGPPPVDDDAEAYCMQRYRSYDPNSGTFLGNDGRRHPCP